MENETQRKLQDGISAARRGDRNTARRLLQDVIDIDPDNELAWIWMASCVTTLAERRNCLERVLEINPNNARARQALEALDADSAPGRQETPLPIEQIRQVQRRPATAAQETSGGGINLINIAIGVLAVVAVLSGLLLFSEMGIGESTPTATPTRTPLPPASRTPLPPPTREPVAFSGTSLAPTLPPTFTPTPTAQPTRTPPPTATAFPVDQFQALLSSLEEGAAQPGLYQLRGDGSELTWLGDGFRDLAYDPSGTNIAFIRDVEYPSDEESGEPQIFPELFVASIGDLNNAQQITELRTPIVSSPTWSPAGDALVFVNDFDGIENLWYITPDGENLRRLTIDDTYTYRDPSWEPVVGSKRVIFASDRDSFGSTEIYSFEIVDPDIEPVYTRLTNSSNSSYSPSWAYNGSLITFISDRGGDADVYIMNPDGSGQTLLTADDSGAEDRRPAFTPDTLYVAFISNRMDDRFQAYLVSINGDVLVRLTDEERNDTSIVFRPELILRLSQ